jgi:RNA polymerase sigma-70 factor, ECF subfamily
VRTVLRVDDIEIIKSFQDGNLGAFDEVVAEFRDALMRHALRRLHDVSAAEDAVQETFVRAYRSFDRLHEASRIGPWLHHILANVCIDEANRRRRDAEKTERASADPFARRSAPGAEQILNLDADSEPLADAIGSLPSSYQEALQLRFVDELSYEEMAVVAGTTEQNVRARVSRARSAMKIALRGVAVFPALMAGLLLRRGSKSAALAERAIERADTTQRLASTAESTVVVSKFATQMAPAIEAVNTIAISAQTAAPSISKAAIGIGAIALAAVSANPERSSVIPPAPAPIVVQVEEPAVADSAVAVAPPTNPAAPTAAPEGDAPIGLAAENLTSSEPAPSALSAGTDAESAPIRAAVEPTTPDSDLVSDGSAPDSEGGPDSVSAPPVDGPESSEMETPRPVVLQGGTATALSVNFDQVGVRTDFAGEMNLKVDGVTTATSFTGRWSIDTDTDRTGGYRLSGAIMMTIGGSVVEMRLAGHAGAESVEARSIGGLFRISNGAAAGLVEAGTFTGSFGPGTLVLQLTP